MGVTGEWKDAEYAELFEEVFSETLKPDYRFVAARPKSNAEQVGAGQPATCSESKPDDNENPNPEAEGRSR